MTSRVQRLANDPNLAAKYWKIWESSGAVGTLKTAKKVAFDFIISDDIFQMAGSHFAKMIKHGLTSSEQLSSASKFLEFVNPNAEKLFNQLTQKVKSETLCEKDEIVLGKMRIAGMLLSDRQFNVPEPEQSTEEITIDNVTLDKLIPKNCLEQIANQFIATTKSGAITDEMVSSNLATLKAIGLDNRFISLIHDAKKRELNHDEKIEFAKFILSGIVSSIYITYFGGLSFS